MTEIKLNDTVSISMVHIPEGSFMIGSYEYELGYKPREGPRTRIDLKSFMMGQTLITREQWEIVADWPKVYFHLNPIPDPTSRFVKDGKDKPVSGISWLAALEFCNRISCQTGYKVTLPTESQWEYACRAGTVTKYNFGNNISADLANFNCVYGKNHYGVTSPKTFPPNDWGLYDMHGNLFEGCLDHWHDNYDGIPTDGSAWLNGADNSIRVLRGGSWYDNREKVRSASRFCYRIRPSLCEQLDFLDKENFNLSILHDYDPLYLEAKHIWRIGLRVCCSL